MAYLRALWDSFWVCINAVDRVPAAPLAVKIGLFSLFVFVGLLFWVAMRQEVGDFGAICMAVVWPSIVPLLPAVLFVLLAILLPFVPVLLIAGGTASRERLAAIVAQVRRRSPPP